MIRPGFNVIIDGQWGSTGKGKLGGYIGNRYKGKIDFACSSFGPNAGHTYVDDDGNDTIFKILPMTALTAEVPALIMPDSVMSLERFYKERSMASNIPIYVHPRTAILQDSDAEAARITGRHIAGTMQGTGHAISRKLLRLEGVKLAKDVLPPEYIRDTCEMVRHNVHNGGCTVFEMSQGFDLSLNHGHDYPYCTSRDITVGACLNSAGVPASTLASVIGSIRTFPIRVGNIEGGYSGPCHPDQKELTWETVAADANGPNSLVERTTVTKRVRRVFTFSIEQIRRFVEANDPDYFFLNFVQYLGWEMNEITDSAELTEAARSFIKTIEVETGVPVGLVGTGAADGQMLELVSSK